MYAMAAGDKIDLSGAWDDLWNALTAGTGFESVTKLMAVIGVALVVFAVVKWAWAKGTGRGGGGGNNVAGALLVGALLAAPDVLLPIVLQIFDVVANAVKSVFESNTRGA